jgi:hypothetical protein
MLHFLTVAASFWGLTSPFTLYFSLFSLNLTVGDRFDCDCIHHQAVRRLRRVPEGHTNDRRNGGGLFVGRPSTCRVWFPCGGMRRSRIGTIRYGSLGSGGVLCGSLRSPLACSNA